MKDKIVGAAIRRPFARALAPRPAERDADQQGQIRAQGPGSPGRPAAEGTAQSLEISRAEAIPKKFLDAILGDLRNAGLVVARKGKNGGYRLARPAAEIMAGAAIRALDGPLAPIGCASRTRYRPCEDCGDVDRCSVRLLMTEVRDLSAKLLDGTSIAAMRGRASEVLQDYTYHI